MPRNVRLQCSELTAIHQSRGRQYAVFLRVNSHLPSNQLRGACPANQTLRGDGISRCRKQIWLFEDLLARDRIERPDIFSYNEMKLLSFFYTSGTARAFRRGDALSSHALPARVELARIVSMPGPQMFELHTIPLFHATVGGVRRVLR